MDVLEEILEGLACRRGCTDIKLFDDDRVAVRCFRKWTTVHIADIKELWPEIKSRLVDPKRLLDPRGCTTTVSVGKRRYRSNFAMHLRGEMLSLRPLPNVVESPANLRIPHDLVDLFIQRSSGLFLVGGRTGMGKSTTIASLIGAKAKVVGGMYVTLENPVEFIHTDTATAIFAQREIPAQISSYLQGLNEAMHQNPDTIVVQEIIDRESAIAALSAAHTGHFVVATLHATTASTLPQRYLSILGGTAEESERWLDSMATCLVAAVVQELVVGTQGLVPTFDILKAVENDGKPILSVQNMLRHGDWSKLRQEIENGSRYGMMTFRGSRELLVRDGLLGSVDIEAEE